MDKPELIEKIKNIQRGITNVKNEYVSEKNVGLDYITVFAHGEDEFKKLVEAAHKIGEKIDEHNGPIFKLKKYLEFDNGTLKVFRIRKPDKERLQKGCGDFKIFDYGKFKNKYINRKNFLLFKGEGFEFLGIHDSTKDYLVYFPNIALTEELGI